MTQAAGTVVLYGALALAALWAALLVASALVEARRHRRMAETLAFPPAGRQPLPTAGARRGAMSVLNQSRCSDNVGETTCATVAERAREKIAGTMT